MALPGKPPSLLRSFNSLIIGSVILILCSCKTTQNPYGFPPVKVKGYPPNTPFVFKTNISLEGSFSKEERKELETRLENQLDDSLQVRTIGKLIMQLLKNPPVYDSTRADRSVTFMQALLRSMGYFRDTISYDTSLLVVKKENKGDQYRTVVNFKVHPGKLVRLDSISYNFIDTSDYHTNQPDLQHLAHTTRTKALVKKGDAFSKNLISSEIDRLVDLYRNNGYLRFTRDDIVGVWDTLSISLLRPAATPLEQILILEELRKQRENPTADLEFRLKQDYDSIALTKYYTGDITIYPDYFGPDSISTKKTVYADSGFAIVYTRQLFKNKFLPQNVYMKKGLLYNQQEYLKTINRFNSLGAWRLVNIEQAPRYGSDTVDMHIYLTPAEKYTFNANFELSVSNNPLIQGNLLGPGISLYRLNRNFGKTSNTENINLRFNTELSTKGNFIFTQQAGISYSLSFPRIIPSIKKIPDFLKEKSKTLFTTSLNNTDRKDFFEVTSFNLSWGYETAWKNKSIKLVIPNIEYTFLNIRSGLQDLINNNPSFSRIFNQGFVFSTIGGFRITDSKKNHINVFTANIEESGLVTGLIKTRAFDSLFRFVKLDAEFIRSMRYGKTQLVTRVYSGVGIALKTPTRGDDPQMPYFRQFFAGGPNSMRAWGLRRLGPGSAVKTDEEAPLRFGDFMFETNVELRYPLANIAGVKITSAVFTDIGNVWFIKTNPDFAGGEIGSIDKFFKDLAVGIGTGLRFDFDFLKIRLDYGLKAKNPTVEPDNIARQNKWFFGWNMGTLIHGVFQLGINYPFVNY